jgi:hypothetical protein
LEAHVEDDKPEREQDIKNLKSVGTLHFVQVAAAITLWGAADAWASASGWGIAHAAAIANAVIAAHIIASTLHEWGHFSGARLAGAFTPVMEKPARYFFMFSFPFEQNDRRQFLWMSWGGIVVPWLLVLLTALLIPIDNASRAMLLAAFVMRAVQISGFELPVVMRTQAGGEPREELVQQVKGGFQRSRYVGFAVGAVVWLRA